MDCEKTQKIFVIRYRKNDKSIEEIVCRQYKDGMSESKASRIRAKGINGEEPTNAEIKIVKLVSNKLWIISKLWQNYKDSKPKLKGLTTDQNRYELHLNSTFWNKIPDEITKMI